jgi:hypothetical protein
MTLPRWLNPPFWWAWTFPGASLLIEFAGGTVLATLVQPVGGAHALVNRFLLATILSVFYEGELDRNGWSWADLGQRALGVALGLALWRLVR